MSRGLRFHPLDLAAAVAFLAYSSSAVVTPIVLVQLGRELGFGQASLFAGGVALEPDGGDPVPGLAPGRSPPGAGGHAGSARAQNRYPPVTRILAFHGPDVFGWGRRGVVHLLERLDLDPTALFILLSCGGIGGFSFASWFIGWLGETHGLDQAFGVVPFLFLVLAGLVWAEGRPPKSPPAI